MSTSITPSRFDEVAVVLVDYAMPVMSGVELCRQLEHCDFFKIMLTGEANDENGLEALNNKTIDKFHRKGEPGMYRDIVSHIRQKQVAYFQELSRIIMHSLPREKCPPVCLTDPHIVQPFFDMLAQNDIAEYYLFSNEGYFLVAGYDGALKWLVLKSEYEMDVLVQLAETVSHDPMTSTEQAVLQEIRDKKAVPLFVDPSDADLHSEHWLDFYAACSSSHELIWWSLLLCLV